MDALIDAVAEILFEVRRRVDDHFDRAPLVLPANDALPLASSSDCTPRSLVQAVAAAAQVPTRDGAPPDAVAELLLDSLRRHWSAAAGSNADWRERVAERVGRKLAAHVGAQAPSFFALPGLERRQTADGESHYLRCGSGATALLLVNAFGLSLDIWHDLVALLARRYTVLVPDEDTPPAQRGGVPRTTYASPDSLPRFLRSVRAMLASEGRASCHVAGWCSGAKLAIELARSWPESVASLMLFAPSFAGGDDDAGPDSAFETNLTTMCKLVERMPQSAESMARSMTALMARNAAAGGDVFALADRVAQPWLQAPFASSAHMVEYSRQLLNFRAHRLGPNPGGEALPLPVLLVTGDRDQTTSCERARTICNDLARPVHFELRAAGHYFIHQNSGLVARLVDEFVACGEQVSAVDARLTRVEAPASLVCGMI